MYRVDGNSLGTHYARHGASARIGGAGGRKGSEGGTAGRSAAREENVGKGTAVGGSPEDPDRSAYGTKMVCL